MRVSVIVPTFNRANYIGECLDSLLNQTSPAIEVIVIDDGSEDATATVVQSYGSRVRYVKKQNGGKPTAVNLGLTLAQGDWIWIFDDDDVALPTAIAERVATLQKYPKSGFVFSPHYYGHDGPDGKIQQGRLHILPAFTEDSLLFDLMCGCFFHLATALVRADVYRSVGGFDTNLLSSEDYDMQLRLARAFPACVCPTPSFVFRQHPGLRGASTIRYQGTLRTKVFRTFDKRIGLKLRDNLALGEYLVPRREVVLSAYEQRHALLARMTVMASKGCLEAMIEDIGFFLRCQLTEQPPSRRELHSISVAMCTGYAPEAIEEQWSTFLSLLATLPYSPFRHSVVRAMALGFFRLAKGHPGTARQRWRRLKQASVLIAQAGF